MRFMQEEVASFWHMGFVVALMARFGQVATCRKDWGLNKQGTAGCVRRGQDAYKLGFCGRKGRHLGKHGTGVGPRWWQVVEKLTFYLHEWQDFSELALYKHRSKI